MNWDECPFEHDNIDRLFGVPPMPIEDLPTVCTCGRPLTYDPDGVLFVNFEVDSQEGEPYPVDMTSRH